MQVTIEKWQGVKNVDVSTGETTDKKIIDQCRSIKQRNPKVPCYMYWDTNTVWDCDGAGPPGFCSGRGTDNVAYVGAITANSDPKKYLLHRPNGMAYILPRPLPPHMHIIEPNHTAIAPVILSPLGVMLDLGPLPAQDHSTLVGTSMPM